MAVPIATATRAIVPMEKNGVKLPALLSATYLPPNKKSDGPVTCYDWNRYKINLTTQKSDSLTQYEFNHNVNVLFCGANKAYYIDGTLSREDAVGLPPLPPPPPPTYVPPPPSPPPAPPAVPVKHNFNWAWWIQMFQRNRTAKYKN